MAASVPVEVAPRGIQLKADIHIVPKSVRRDEMSRNPHPVAQARALMLHLEMDVTALWEV